MLTDAGSVQVIRYADDVPERCKDALLDRINNIIGEHWTTTGLVWSRDISPFHRYFGIALCHQHDRVVGYAIYRRLRVGDRLAIYRAGAGVSAASRLAIALQNASVAQSFDAMRDVNAALHEVTSSCVACHTGYRVH